MYTAPTSLGFLGTRYVQPQFWGELQQNWSWTNGSKPRLIGEAPSMALHLFMTLATHSQDECHEVGIMIKV